MVRQVAGQEAGVGPHAVDEVRLAAPRERHAQHVHAGPGQHPAVVHHISFPVQQRRVEPRVAPLEPRGPHHRPVPGQLDGVRRCPDLGRRRALVGPGDPVGPGEVVDLVEQAAHLQVGIGAQVGQ